MRLPTALFPVLKCRDAYADHASKLRLRFLKLLPNCANVFRIEGEFARRWNFAAMNTSSLFDARNKVVKQLFLHLNSRAMSCRNAFFCDADKSSCSLFEYMSRK